MRRNALLCAGFVLLLSRSLASAQIGATGGVGEHLTFQVDGASRDALIYIPASAKASPTPVVFVFHGHGGNSANAQRAFPMHRAWPEAISVYMQGLKTPGRLTDPEGKLPGWQKTLGDQGDRDLHFFDTVLARLRHDYRVDEKRIYATGHSNGGAFTYLLWAERGEIFAAMAPCAALSVDSARKIKPKPALHIAGEKDPLVKFEWQKKMMDTVRKVDGCDASGQTWAPNCTLYPSQTGTPVVAYIHPGAHIVPPDAPALIVRFFKEHPAK